MPTETTPLRGAQPQRSLTQRINKQRLAGLAAFIVVVIVAVSLWVSTSGSHGEHSNGASSVKSESPCRTAAQPSIPAELQCGVAKNEAGYIKLPNKKDEHFFYWMFESRSSPSTDPLVVWLTGGAGCSSLVGLLTENGPCKVNADLTTTLNPYSWNTEANVIWLDQPSGTGFSYGLEKDLDHDMDGVQENIYWFLQGFLDKHPEFEDRPLFITGESYAGHYIPATAHYIWLRNKEIDTLGKSTRARRINLDGIAIGNGLINPVIQFAHYLDMTDNAYNITPFDETQLEAAKQALPLCLDVLRACQTNSSACVDVFDMETGGSTCGLVVKTLGSANRNVYDIRTTCYESNYLDCYSATDITKYLNLPAVQTYLNISQTSPVWQECSAHVAAGFAGDRGKNFAPYIEDLLNDDALRILFYYGDADLMCNWIGGKAWVSQLEWKHQAEFNAAPDRAFEVAVGADSQNQPVLESAGSVKSFQDRLTYLRVFNAGHLVPRNQPLVALEMLRRFLRSEQL